MKFSIRTKFTVGMIFLFLIILILAKMSLTLPNDFDKTHRNNDILELKTLLSRIGNLEEGAKELISRLERNNEQL